MKIHGLDLDNSPLISQDKALRYAQNIAIGEGNQSYINEDGFIDKLDIKEVVNHIIDLEDSSEFNETSYVTNSFKIIGTIPTNIGVVLFCVFEAIPIQGGLYLGNAIVYIKTDSDTPIIDTIVYDFNHEDYPQLNFSINRPIHGDYIYNYKNELIITFTEGISETANETRIINLNSPDGCSEPITRNGCKIYVVTNVSMFNLIPDVEYPILNIEVKEGGNLKTGAYQIAIAYKLADGTYTNYSILSVPSIVCANYGDDVKPDVEINKKLVITFQNAESNNYKQYKLAIVHIVDTSQNCYETEDLNISDTNEYKITNLINYQTIVLDDIFIKSISYIREQTLVNYNNRLIRGNVQTLNIKSNKDGLSLEDTLINFTKNHISIGQKSISNNDAYTKRIKYFKNGEIYVPYVGYIDYKGDLINIYNISKGCNKIINGINCIEIQSKFEEVNADIGEVIYQNVPSAINNYFGSIINFKTDDWNLKGIKDQITITTNKIDLTRGGLFKNPITFETINVKWILPNESIDINISTNRIKYGDDIIEFKDTKILIYNLTGVYNNDSGSGEDIILNEKLNIETLTDDYIKQTISGSKGVYTNTTNSSQLISIIIIDSSNKNNIDHADPTIVSLNTTPQILECSIENDLNTNIVKSVVYFYIEHNSYNSNILSQGLIFPDTNINNFNTTIQDYKGQFKGENSLRFYPFEFLFNKTNKLNGKLNIIRNIKRFFNKYKQVDASGNFLYTNINGMKFEKSYNVLIPETDKDINDKATVNTEGINILDCNINDSINYKYQELQGCKLEFVESDNTSVQNIAGDSFYRVINKSIKDLPSTLDYYIGDFVNEDVIHINDENENLQVASSIQPLKKGSCELVGDTFLSYLTLRLTTPSEHYAYGLSDQPGLDSNNTVYRWILTFPIESRFNLNARYGSNIINKPYFLHNGSEIQYKELFGLSYKVDNFINTDVGKGYNTVYNENGIEEFEYYREIPGTSNHPHRIIRSLPQSAESTNLNWRIFKTDDYKDLPFNRGEIISLKTDNKNLYIQQKYGLHLLQQRDQLNNDDTNDSYLGTSDLFNMEPKEIVYSPSGYIGCESYFDTNVNIAGYVVIDAVHKKIFLINGDKSLEISNIKTREYFEKFIDDSLRNPYNKQGRIINYNEDRNILYITQISPHLDGTKTISFSPLNKAWVSFHTYIPDWGFVNRNGLFWGKNGKLYQPNSTIKGKYWNDTAEPSVIQFILNENTIYNKLLKTIVWKDQVSYKGDDYIQHFFKETINHIMVHNFDQCSGELDVAFNNNPKEWWNGDTGTNKINLWRFNKLFDLVTNPENPFMIDDIKPDYTKLKWKDSKPDYKWYEVNRFICQFIYLTMWYDNIPINDKYHEWELIDVHPEWQLDNRNDQTYGNKDNNQ